MKRKFTILTAALALLAFLALPMGMRGQTRDVETFTFSELGYGNAEDVTTVVGDDVTLTFDAGTNASNSPKYYNTGSGVRMYAGNTLEVALNNQSSNTRITAIDFTFSGSSYTGGLQNWTGSETSHTFTATGTARIQVIAVTFSEGGTAPTTYTVTYYANVAGTAPVVDTYAEGADVTLRAANTFTNEGYTFSEWNTQADGDGDAYDAGEEIENIQGNIELYAIWTANTPSNDHWVLTSLTDLTENDVLVIVGDGYAMTNDNGTGSAPATSAVTIANNEITSTVAANIQWTVSGDATNGYSFSPNGSTNTWLYCNTNASSSSNNNMRVGNGGTYNRKVFELNSSSYLQTKDSYTTRYLSIYNDADWRGYVNTNLCPVMSFYKKVTGGVLPPSISAENVGVGYDATSGRIFYTINNEPNPAGTLTAATTSDWLTLPNTFSSPIEFTCTINEAATERTATVTLTYTYNRESVTTNVTVTQAGNPNVTPTIAEVREQGTGSVVTKGTITSITGSNNKTAYIQDATAAIVVYGNFTAAVGDEIRVSGTLQEFNGLLEITSPTVNVISSGNTINPELMTIAQIVASTNQGWYIRIEEATVNTISGQNVTIAQGNNTIVVRFVSTDDITFEANDVIYLNGNIGYYNNANQIANPQNVEVQQNLVASITVDPDEVNVDAEDHDGTLDLTYENLPITEMTDFDIQYYDAEGEETTEPDWIEVLVAEQDPEIGEGYLVSYMIDVNEGEARTAYFKVYAMDDETNLVYSNLVTVSQGAYVAPSSNKYVKVTSSADLTDGQYLIVYEDGSLAFDGSLETLDAVGNTITVTINNNEIAVTETTSASEFTINTTAGTIKSASGYYIGQTSDANGLQANQETEYTNAISFEEGDANIVSSGGAYLRYNNASNQSRFRYFKSSTYTGQKAIQLYKKVYTLDITGYGESAGGYYLIASPVTVNPANVEGMTEGHFDLFRFNESADYEWENWKVEGDHYHFNLVPGQGYLYAHKTDVTLTFTGTPYNGEPIILSKTDGNGIDWPGWNLVGNPYYVTAYLDRDFYTMNSDGDEIVAATNRSVEALEGVFVIANSNGEELTFSTEAPAASGEKIVVNVSNTNGKLLDRAMIRFGEGGQLPKFQINENSTKLYINEGEEEFAVVRCINESSTPVSFRAAENGTYTLSINTENVEMEYLHLIDNLTGADIDLLATPSYTFESNTTDNVDRFAVVYTATTSVNENNAKPFAFFNGSEWVIMNEGNATMQVVDVTGRVISTEALNGNATINLIQVPGVYMFRLVNGNDVKVQKVVVK